MASVTSLDADMKRLRLSRYTPQAANEIRTWIEDTLGESIPSGDLLNVLKDGTILCELANLTLPTPIKYKSSAMPFIQMENISHFLRACENPPLNMPSHDRFLTVDLYEAKDPAQVLQCLGAFSRVAHSLKPSVFRTTIGPKRAGGGISMSPIHTGGFSSGGGTPEYPPRMAPSSGTPGKSHSPVRKNVTGGGNSVAEPGSILYSGYMGGASQGNQGIAFGARRQITTAAPHVPSLAEKERQRREKQAEDDRLQMQREDEKRRERLEIEMEEERAKKEEEQRWEEESRRAREEERLRVEKQKKEWEEQEKKWKEEEERKLAVENHKQVESQPSLKGQYLSEYQAEQKSKSRQVSYNDPQRLAERQKIQELERQLEEAKAMEQQYQEERSRRAPSPSKSNTISSDSLNHYPSVSSTGPRPISPPESNVSWTGDERQFLRKQHQDLQAANAIPIQEPERRPLPEPVMKTLTGGSRPLPQPTSVSHPASQPVQSSRPLPTPASPPQQNPAAYLASPPTPTQSPSTSATASASEQSSPAAARPLFKSSLGSSTSRSSWATSSFLERERERERQRQKEWEEAQRETVAAKRDDSQGLGPGQTWDVNQYGYMGGDNQNKGASGIGFGGKRQIIGPRPPP